MSDVIATDDREIEYAGGKCSHPKCLRNGQGCRMYNEETVQITEADAQRGRELVAEGWWSTSQKYRAIARWREPVPTLEALFAPGMLDTFHGQRLGEVVRKHLDGHYGCGGPAADPHLERATLSVSLFRAFKQAGGDCGR